MSWQKMDTAPKDGRLVWLLVKPWVEGVSLVGLPWQEPWRYLARYDTWNSYWRENRTGEPIQKHPIQSFLAWHVCFTPEPLTREEVELL
jgi:hypothetical protein